MRVFGRAFSRGEGGVCELEFPRFECDVVGTETKPMDSCCWVTPVMDAASRMARVCAVSTDADLALLGVDMHVREERV